ncbi:ribonuclease P/MRP protein subunit POP1 [Vigna unguiculata]|uniref:Ribonuclease P/MRP protein subunit POP1 n=2 Tax=Vigna unguiculata TaxID=3917 RepID=A0A4D6NI53_VIGUN|nr:ribonuclease P/MRP protein subunit POP1 [Vigna unguiculata]
MSVRFLTRHRVVASSIFFLWDCIYSIETKQEQPEFLVPLVVVSQFDLFMMDFVGPVLDIIIRLWDCCAYVRDYEENISCLRDVASDLLGLWVDVSVKVQLAEAQHLRRLNEVNDWLVKVEAMQREVQAIQQRVAHAQETRSRCSTNFPTSCRMGRIVSKKIGEIRELIDKGHFDVVAQEMPYAVVDEIPLEVTIGLESTFEELGECFDDNNVGIIGLFGMGGVGKTTLLKKFNNEFLPTKFYDVVIWVVVSKEADVGSVQQSIGNKLNVPVGKWGGKSIDDRAIVLYNFLKRKKFVLLLDDLWERIDLLKLGIPLPDTENGSKVIFTTRSMEVCRNMEANRCIKVECLAPNEAFALFREKVGEETLNSHPEIFLLAQIVAKECEGLPLALITVGRSMARKTLPEWKRAARTLKIYPSRFSGMVDYVYCLLEFSYDSLPSASHKSCFLYCSIFPEDYDIRKDELIQLWIGEGLLAEFGDDVYEARIQGEEIIASLKFACLLEDSEKENRIKMHDVIRDMALWLACDHGSNTRFLVRDGASSGSVETYNQAKWKEVEKLSMWRHSIQKLSGKQDCSNLLTMLVRNTEITNFPDEIFLTANHLRVLDLSGNKRVRELPSSIGELVQLQHLDLSGTDIQKLPRELQNLKKLRCLLLNYICNRLVFPRKLISSLVSLQVFSKLPWEDQFILPDLGEPEETVLLKELECLECLQDISIALFCFSSMQVLLNSSKLQRCIRHLRVLSPFNSTPHVILFSLLTKMQHLEVLSMSVSSPSSLDHVRKKGSPSQVSMTECIPMSSKITEHGYIVGLRELSLEGCGMLNLNWLTRAPSLQLLRIYNCPSLEEVIGEEELGHAETVFSSLEIVDLDSLPKLRSMCSQVLQFPCLKEICVADCPKLIKLPFDSNSARNSLKHINGQKSWWRKLQWEDEATRDHFASKYVPLRKIHRIR